MQNFPFSRLILILLFHLRDLTCLYNAGCCRINFNKRSSRFCCSTKKLRCRWMFIVDTKKKKQITIITRYVYNANCARVCTQSAEWTQNSTPVLYLFKYSGLYNTTPGYPFSKNTISYSDCVASQKKESEPPFDNKPATFLLLPFARLYGVLPSHWTTLPATCNLIFRRVAHFCTRRRNFKRHANIM